MPNNEEKSMCENCVFFHQDIFTDIGECLAKENTLTHCKVMVYKKDSAKFCEDYTKKENEEDE